MKNIAIATLALIGMTSAYPKEDFVPFLPGMNDLDSRSKQPFDFKMYSGYLPIPETTKELHYLFLEARHVDPKFAPLIVWYNGGPGCSSMLAFMQEHGPFEIKDGDTDITPNPFSWNNQANMLYIEQPAGVGYSWGDCQNKPEQCDYDDNLAGRENLASLLQFYEKFPEMKTNDLYISGESYAGIYVPFTVNEIHHHNAVHARNPSQFKPNLKGFMVGNGCTDWEYDTSQSFHEMAYWHSLIPGSLWEKMIQERCDYSGNEFGISATKECMFLQDIFQHTVRGVNIYNIIGQCYGGMPTDTQPGEKGEVTIGGKKQTYNKVATALDMSPWRFRDYQNLGEVPPCIYGEAVIEYLNKPDVRKALHIPDYVQPWDMCQSGNTFHWTYTPLQIGSKWVYEGLKGEYRMLKFSGDVDGAVPTTGTRNWINSLNRPVTEPWRQWFINGAKTPAGSIIEYEGLTFATVHGAGHMVPQFKPAEAYHLIFNWIN